MTKLLLLPLLIAFACVLAGIYGAIHDQISYTVSPDYFHEFKFYQFHIATDFQNRLGASIVGWRASWWMGVIIGLPIYVIGLFVRGNELFIKAYIRAALIVMLVTFTVGIVALLGAFVTVSEGNLPDWTNGRHLTNPVAFARAGTMHNFSYMGGLIGLLVGSLVIAREAWLSRRSVPTQSKDN